MIHCIKSCFTYSTQGLALSLLNETFVHMWAGEATCVCACACVIMANPHTWRHSICGSIACVCVGMTEPQLVHCYPKGSIERLLALRCKYLNLNYRDSDLREQCGRWAPQMRQSYCVHPLAEEICAQPCTGERNMLQLYHSWCAGGKNGRHEMR